MAEEENVDKPKVFPIFAKNFRPKLDPLRAVQLDLEKAAAPRKKMKRTMLSKETDGR
jgi:hypothetical protein